MKDYKGTIVEESLIDNRILNEIHIIGVRISRDENPTKRWHIYTAKVSKKEIQMLSENIKQKWYMHFWKDRQVIAIFKDKIFEFDFDDKNTWRPVLEHGVSLGIPKEQLDFPIDGS